MLLHIVDHPLKLVVQHAAKGKLHLVLLLRQHQLVAVGLDHRVHKVDDLGLVAQGIRQGVVVLERDLEQRRLILAVLFHAERLDRLEKLGILVIRLAHGVSRALAVADRLDVFHRRRIDIQRVEDLVELVAERAVGHDQLFHAFLAVFIAVDHLAVGLGGKVLVLDRLVKQAVDQRLMDLHDLRVLILKVKLGHEHDAVPALVDVRGDHHVFR